MVKIAPALLTGQMVRVRRSTGHYETGVVVAVKEFATAPDGANRGDHIKVRLAAGNQHKLIPLRDDINEHIAPHPAMQQHRLVKAIKDLEMMATNYELDDPVAPPPAAQQAPSKNREKLEKPVTSSGSSSHKSSTGEAGNPDSDDLDDAYMAACQAFEARCDGFNSAH